MVLNSQNLSKYLSFSYFYNNLYEKSFYIILECTPLILIYTSNVLKDKIDDAVEPALFKITLKIIANISLISGLFCLILFIQKKFNLQYINAQISKNFLGIEKIFTSILICMTFSSVIILYFLVMHYNGNVYFYKPKEKPSYLVYDLRNGLDENNIVNEFVYITTHLNYKQSSINYCFEVTKLPDNKCEQSYVLKKEFNNPPYYTVCSNNLNISEDVFDDLVNCSTYGDSYYTPMYCNTFEYRYEKYSKLLFMEAISIIIFIFWINKYYMIVEDFYNYH